MAFQTIGFAAALILNRLRNEQQVARSGADNDGDLQKQQEQEQAVRAEFIRLNDKLLVLKKKLATEAARVEPAIGRRKAGN